MAPTGIDDARPLETAHQAELAQGSNYAALTSTPAFAENKTIADEKATRTAIAEVTPNEPPATLTSTTPA